MLPKHLAASLSLIILGSACLPFGPDLHSHPAKMEANLSQDAKQLLAKAFNFGSIGTDQLILADYHVHAAARGTHSPSRDAYLNPELHSLFRPFRWLKTCAFMQASGVTDINLMDTQYETRLLDLLLHFQEVQRKYMPPGQSVESRFYLYALDYFHDEQGRPVKDNTDLYVPNGYVITLAERINQALMQVEPHNLRNKVSTVPVASVHPYRQDFKSEVRKLAKQGVRYIKWLPPAMNIDLDIVSGDHYRALAENNMVLLSHTGPEHVFRVKNREHQYFGDPVKLRKALDHGVVVVALHGARRGKHLDESYFERFLKLMNLSQYQDKLFGEISVMMTGRAIAGDSRALLLQVIEASQAFGPLHQRMLNGSDYPVPAVAFLQPTKGLAKLDMITTEQKKWLDEIYRYNPLLFDFVAKRTLRHPKTGDKLPDDLFFPLEFKLANE